MATSSDNSQVSSRRNGSSKRAAGKPKKRSYNSMANPPSPAAFKFKPAASYLSISEPSLRRLVARGEIKSNRELRHLIFPRPN